METTLFVLLALVAIGLGLRTRQVLAGGPHGRRPAAGPMGTEPLGSYELAFLAGGSRRVVDTAIVRLHAGDALLVSRDGRLTATAPAGVGAIEDAVVDLAEGGADLTDVRFAALVDPAVEALEGRLVAAGLARRIATPLTRGALIAAWVVLVALVWCAALFEPGTAIVVGVAVTAIACAAGYALCLRGREPLTPAGARALGRARKEWGRLDWDRQGPPDTVGGAALFGRRGLHDGALGAVFRASDTRIRRSRGGSARSRAEGGGPDRDPSGAYNPRLGQSYSNGGCFSSCGGSN
ncbi:TIGR04222 domain-containing membrane protein [Embleya sp. NBC_00888]|uniref:TIGR04222 domain-containing membrane protein n=1 Tax=Embleya sp. NBC_00888 TaxID=2975960 RepID=UPI0038633BF9|nr:TIGR04222 domain-containing membrane protein [Embleya sp. NBC_00888]